MPKEIRSSLQDQPPEQRRQIEQVWHLLDQARDGRRIRPSLDQAWTEMLAAIVPNTVRTRTATRAPARRRTLLAMAAAVVVLVSFWWMARPAAVSTSAGEQQAVRLPDGSVVEMNSETTVHYERLFARWPAAIFRDRRVRLEGEAYFRVVPSSTPFIVETHDAAVEVLGTEFNVRARDGGAGTVVTLATGRVRLSARGAADRTVTLADSGDAARVAPMGDVVRAPQGEMPSLAHVLAWRHTGFAVVDEPLRAVLDEVERRYAVEIAPRDGVDPTDPMSLFYLRGAEPEQILRDVCLIQACSFRRTSRGFALSERTAVPDDSSEDPAAPYPPE